MEKMDVVIIGAGAAGLMCAIEAAKRNRKVIVLDHANKVGKKILMSGGGRCNFTNYNIQADNYISHNPHFCKSALERYTQWDFINLVNDYRIPFHEKAHGQLFCDNKSQDILNMLLMECEKYNAKISLHTSITEVQQLNNQSFKISSNKGDFNSKSLVIATGGLSIPTLGASPFGYHIAKQFNIRLWPTSAGLVPFTLQPEDKLKFSPLSGIAIKSSVSNSRKYFDENILFTHRGLSGPAILQISSYWKPGEDIIINLLPQLNLIKELKALQIKQPQKQLKTVMSDYLPKRVAEVLINVELGQKKLHSISHVSFEELQKSLQSWRIKPNGTEGYRTAEVTLGGVDCDAISSKTMEAHKVKGLYFIGEALDVTGWLGGYNFQWAWSSGWAAGQVV